MGCAEQPFSEWGQQWPPGDPSAPFPRGGGRRGRAPCASPNGEGVPTTPVSGVVPSPAEGIARPSEEGPAQTSEKSKKEKKERKDKKVEKEAKLKK